MTIVPIFYAHVRVSAKRINAIGWWSEIWSCVFLL